MFTRDTSRSGQVVQQKEPRMRAQEAALNGVAYSKLRRLLARSKSFDCPDIAVGDSALFSKARIAKDPPAGADLREF